MASPRGSRPEGDHLKLPPSLHRLRRRTGQRREATRDGRLPSHPVRHRLAPETDGRIIHKLGRGPGCAALNCDSQRLTLPSRVGRPPSIGAPKPRPFLAPVVSGNPWRCQLASFTH
ncbi:hypothetical protein SETIT_3G059900v2 [Setaria italica]|uniref:Uncharacterized protein n=1 Tax=Setaria italica TaxID=4555 RepID=A0A368QDZ2_SETIT|nr:hypothetical protein SETIT_3G059900v2 [Setaria italica]